MSYIRTLTVTLAFRDEWKDEEPVVEDACDQVLSALEEWYEVYKRPGEALESAPTVD